MNEVDVFKALADPTRLKIIECVENGEKCIAKSSLILVNLNQMFHNI